MKTVAHVIFVTVRDLALEPQVVRLGLLLLGKVRRRLLTGLDRNPAVTHRSVQLVPAVRTDGAGARDGSGFMKEDNRAVLERFALPGHHPFYRGSGEFPLAARQQDHSHHGQGNKDTHESSS